MRINYFDDSDAGGFDPRNYAPFGAESSAGNLTANTFTTIINITGEGFLDRAVVRDSANTVDVRIKITLDGVVVHDVSTIQNKTGTGFIQPKDIFDYANASTARFFCTLAATTAANYGQVISTVPAKTTPNTTIALLSTIGPLFFYESCTVEINPITSTNISYLVMGGLLT